MSTLQDDIKRLREKYVFGTRQQSQEVDETVFRICDALETYLNPHLGSDFTEYLAESNEQLSEDLEASLKENEENARLLGMSGERELALRAKLEVSLKDNDALSQSFYDCNKYAVELEAKLAARPNITNERLRQIRAKLVRRWKEIKDLEDQVDVQGAANARLEMKLEQALKNTAPELEDLCLKLDRQVMELEDQVNRRKARAEKKGEQAEAGHLKLEKCIAFLRKAEDYEHPVATEAHDLLKELGIGLSTSLPSPDGLGGKGE